MRIVYFQINQMCWRLYGPAVILNIRQFWINFLLVFVIIQQNHQLFKKSKAGVSHVNMQISEMYKKRKGNLEWRKFLLFAFSINLNFLSAKNQLSISVLGEGIPCDVITYVNSHFIAFALQHLCNIYI